MPITTNIRTNKADREIHQTKQLYNIECSNSQLNTFTHTGTAILYKVHVHEYCTM